MLILSLLRPAAAIAARITVAATAGALSIADAPAAQPGRPAVAQHAGPIQHAAPMFRPVPIQHAPPHVINGSRPVGVMPTFTPPGNANLHATNPSLYRANPNLPFNNPGALRPNLPLNNPSALRPNFPVDHQGAQPGLGAAPAPAFNLPNPVGNPAPSQAADGLRTGAGQPFAGQPLASQPVPGQALAGQPLAGQIPASRPVIRPLLKPPPGGFPQTRPAFPVVQRNDRFWPLHKDGKSLFFHGQRRVFVPVALLGVILIGDSYWYPDAYVSMEGPACTGYTAEGCQLEWRMVDFEDGGGEPQCVQYCPQAGPPPQQVATLPPPPPLAQAGACQTTIYSEPNFAGNSAPTGDSQPVLSSTGWRNEIASIVVAAGTWDFFADENFGGESLRLGPGTYPRLTPEWARHIGSFMCVEPGPPPA